MMKSSFALIKAEIEKYLPAYYSIKFIIEFPDRVLASKSHYKLKQEYKRFIASQY